MRPELSGGRTHYGEPIFFEREITAFPCFLGSALSECRRMCSESVHEVSRSVAREAGRRQAHVLVISVFEKGKTRT